MAKSNLIVSAATKEELENQINKYFFSKNYTITDNMEVFNKVKNKVLDGFKVIIKKDRWRFERT